MPQHLQIIRVEFIVTENNIEYLLVDKRKGTIKITEAELTIDFGIAFDDIAYVFKR